MGSLEGGSTNANGSPDPTVDYQRVPGDDAVLRRLSSSDPDMLSTDLSTGERRPSSGAFKPDGDGVSVFREMLLHNAELGARDIVKSEVNLVVRLPVKAVRSTEQLDITDDAWPADVDDPDRPCYVAHALITGWDGLGKKRRIRLQRHLAQHPELTFVIG